MFVIRKKLAPDEGAPPNTRQNPDTGEVETSADGGATWTPDPAADPRRNDANRLPPTEDGRCAAAAGMIAQMEVFVEGVFGGTTLVGAATLVLGGMVAAIPGIGWMIYTAILIAGGIISSGGATLQAAFTPEVWEDLLCILFCNMDENGQISNEQLEDIQEQIVALHGFPLATATSLIWEAWGAVGLSNAGVLNADPAADCSDCDCSWEVKWSAALGNLQEWFVSPNLAGTGAGYYTGDRWRGAITQTPGSVGAMFLGISRQLVYDASTVIQGVSVKYNGNRANGNLYRGYFRTTNAAGGVGQSTNPFTWATGSNLNWNLPGFNMTTSPSFPFAQLFFQNNASVGADLFEALEITIAGVGFNPFQ